jgi:chaperonin cofactor prefoldin
MRPALDDVKALVVDHLPDNAVGAITPAKLREVLQELLDYLEDLEARVEALE